MAGSEIQPEAGQGRPDRAGVVLLAPLVAAVANLNLSVANNSILLGAVLVYFAFLKHDEERRLLAAYHEQDTA